MKTAKVYCLPSPKSLYGLLHLVLLLIASTTIGFAQKKTKPSLRDTLDGKFDFSSFLIDAHGFVPVPLIITEPALGGFGGALAPLFITPNKPGADGRYVPPNITAGFGMYTANGSWAAGAFHSGVLPKAKMKYRIGGGYGDINLSYFRDIPLLGEKEFAFNMQVIPLFGSISRQITKSGLHAGMQYLYLVNTITPKFADALPEDITRPELDASTGTLGLFLDWDKRNTVFTPDKGFHANLKLSLNDTWTGSDFAFQKLNQNFVWFTPVKQNWISGLRFEAVQTINDPPFYLLPSINLRGIPAARYQGRSTIVVETEQRFDLNLRWSVLGFAGWGNAIGKNESIGSGKNVYNVGGGFRYLMARVFKLRAGIDVAAGPDSWGWYIVFGHNWNR